MQEARHQDTGRGRVNRTEVLPPDARRLPVVRACCRRDALDRLHDAVEAEAERSEHLSGALEDGARLRDDVARADDLAPVVHRLHRRQKQDAGGSGASR